MVTDVRNNILMISTTVNFPADSLSELEEVSLFECRQVGHCVGGAGGLFSKLHRRDIAR
jgi:hypothetical protein